MPAASNPLRAALADRVLVADGAMGTMLQAANPTLADFQGHEGCNEILNVTRPELVAEIHRAYFEVGVDLVETNSFGANLANLGEYGIADRIYELNLAAARIARQVADEFSTADKPRFVIGSMGPGTKLPSLGHISFAELRDAYELQAKGLLDGGADCLLVETCQDLLQVKAAVVGAQRAKRATGVDCPVWAQVTVETTGTMLLGSEIGAALTSLVPLGIESIGLNCATGPLEMSEHLRYLAQHSPIRISAMPNAGLPIVTAAGAHYPLGPAELAAAQREFVEKFGLSVVGGCCGTTPAHLAAVVSAVAGCSPTVRKQEFEPAVSSLYSSVALEQDVSVLNIGERTNANGSKAFREALLAGDDEACLEIARSQVREGSHLLDLCVDYVGRDGVADMRRLAGLFATSTTLPIVLDSTEPKVIAAGLEMLGGRAIVNSVNFEDGDGPDSRYQQMMRLVREHGAAVVALTIDETGQARTVEHKLAVARRLVKDLCDEWGLSPADIMLDLLTFPIATGQDETRRDGLATLEAIGQIKSEFPTVKTVLGLSNISFGLNPAARQVLNSVFLHEAVAVGLDAAILHVSKILPLARIPAEQLQAAQDLIFDRRAADFDPLTRFLELFADATVQGGPTAAALSELPLFERLERRVIDGERVGLDADIALALAQKPALEIVNTHLLAAMREVGERFGRGEMQLPFVLQSAEVMKQAVALLEPHMEKVDSSGKGKIVLATVKGDVHDIGKNLVDIILSNNGYEVLNIGIKQPISAILAAAEAEQADAIGMSGLLVKSTMVMKENLQDMNARGVARNFPIILGGAALTRAFVEQDLNDIYDGEVRYAKDAFEGLALMDAIMAVKRGEPGAALPAPRQRRVAAVPAEQPPTAEGRSQTPLDNPVPAPPFIGGRVVRGIPLPEIVEFLDLRSLFIGQWGLKPGRGSAESSYEELVEREGMPRLRYWLDRARAEGIFEPAVLYGFWPARAAADSVFVKTETGSELEFVFPRQSGGRRLCLADYVHASDDNVGFHVVTMGSRVSEVTGELFAANSFRDYLELHGLSVALTEALAEYWHARIRKEWGIDAADAAEITGILKQQYQGERYSFGYPACPDLGQQVLLDQLLDFSRIGVSLSDEYQLHPEQSTSAIIMHHPAAGYFNAN